MKYWMQNINKILRDWESYVLDGDCRDRRRIFIDRGGDVLFVAHLDTVQVPCLVGQDGDYYYGAGFDDRVGCYVATKLGGLLKADVLLTDLEESGCSTAQYHQLRDYNWIVEFDREGDDVVMYDIICPELEAAVSDYWPIGLGSFTDICFLDTDIGRYNLGIGYQDAHSKLSRFSVDTLKKQVNMFKEFYNKYQKVKFRTQK